MKKLPLFLLASALVLGASCSSGAKKSGDAEVAPEEKAAPRVFKLDYDLVDASDKELPSWIKDPTKVDSADEKKKFRYFINESSHESQRLCERSAEARASARIAQEIAQFMKNTYSEATQGGGDESVSEYMQEQLAQQAQSFIVGAAVVKKYWEKRSYKETLGAAEDKVKYYCYAVVKMSKKDVEKAVASSRAKLLGGIEDPEVKKKTNNILKDADKAFSDLEKPVDVKKTDSEE